MLKVDIENGYTIFTDSEFGDSEVRFPLDSDDAPDSEMQKCRKQYLNPHFIKHLLNRNV